jgi:hypothetical protein
MSALCFTIYSAVLAAYTVALVDLKQAAALTMILEGRSRIVMERFRMDISGNIMGF